MAEKDKQSTTLRINWRYALGEIAIVAIGILLAFQLNSWKEKRKDLEREKNSMAMLLTEVKKDSAIFNALFIQATNHKRDALAILQMLNSDNPYDYADSLATCYRRCGSYNGTVLHRSAFQMMTAQGTLNLLRNDTLRNMIYSYYDRTHKVVEIWASAQKDMVNAILPKLYEAGIIDDLQVQKTSGLKIYYKDRMLVDELMKDVNRSKMAIYMRSQNDMLNITHLNRRNNKELLTKLRAYTLKL